MTRLLESQRDVRALSGLTICCIGPRTAEALAVYGLRADVIPEQFQAEGILEVLAARQMRGARVLIPRALVARELLPDQLRTQGADVDVVPVYRTIRPAVATDRLMEQLRIGGIDVISFTSSSTGFFSTTPQNEEMTRLSWGMLTGSAAFLIVNLLLLLRFGPHPELATARRVFTGFLMVRRASSRSRRS